MSKRRWHGILLPIIAIGTVALVLFLIVRSRTFQFFGKYVTRVETDQKVIALTLDDGPTPRTAEILETLKALDIPATFYLCGNMMEERPEDAKAIAAAGHEIGNHSYSHRHMVFVSYDFCAREIEDTSRLIREAGYEGAINFRPPYFNRLFVLPWYLKNAGITTILADVEPESALGFQADAGALADDLIKNARDGSIVLMHPMYNENSLEAIRLAVPQLKAEGYAFVTVNQLIGGNT